MSKLRVRYLFFVLIVLLVTIFFIEFLCINSYIESMFQYTNSEIKNNALNNELREFKFLLLDTFLFLFLQSLGMFFCLNIGLLCFDIKVKIKNIVQLIILSSFAIIIYQFLTILIIKINGWTFTVGSINSVSEKLSIANYVYLGKTISWTKLSLSSINLFQLLTITLLTIGIHKILLLNYKRAFFITLRTYGIGILLWFVFAMVMEMNFG
ncbi:membrane hypothetical protein [Tenacibaculum sediminilitoris]|uniref:hypothetical protein n=1 Tax=Tenacibaculum sediminilitoris TaxID=1820334 RepID=UPI0038952C21